VAVKKNKWVGQQFIPWEHTNIINSFQRGSQMRTCDGTILCPAEKSWYFIPFKNTYRPFKKQAISSSLVFVLHALFFNTSRFINVVTRGIEYCSLKGGQAFHSNYHIAHDRLTQGRGKSKDREMTVIV
jgi:hypothetical protein